MLLSEAIRLGAMLGPQLFGNLAHGQLPGASCAIGSAMLATGCVQYAGEEAIVDRERWGALFPPLAQRDYFCEQVTDLWRQIAYRNNELRMSREQIADWLVESGNDCASVETAPAQEIAAALVTAHMEAQ